MGDSINVHESIKALKLFNEKANKLRMSNFTQIVFNQKNKLKLIMKRDEPVIVERKGPDQETIDAFILTFRFFIQDNEKSSFRNLGKIYEDLPISQDKKDIFKNVRQQLNDFLDSNHSMFIENGKQLKFRYIFEVFIYGGLSHANEQKKEIFDRWLSIPIYDQFMIHEFVFIISNIMNFITFVQGLNEEVIKELETKKFNSN